MNTKVITFPYPLIQSTVRRLNLAGRTQDARAFAKRAYIMRTEADVRALVRGYFPEGGS